MPKSAPTSLQWRVLRSDSVKQCEANAKIEHVAASDVKRFVGEILTGKFWSEQNCTNCLHSITSEE